MVDVYTPPAHAHATSPVNRDSLWWVIAAVGIGILVLAKIIAFFDGDADREAAEIFSLLGWVALVVGMTLAAVMGTALSWGARAALLIAGAFFALEGGFTFGGF